MHLTAQTALILIDVQLGLDDARLGARSNPAAEQNMARLASDLGYEVFVAADATASHECLSYDGRHISAEMVQAVALANLHREFATVRTTAEFLGSVSNPASMERHPIPQPTETSAINRPPPDSSGGLRGVATAASET